jgi:signal transduction histidine kinase/HPt (histidine-containing phosphotransfer) domain-containing protein
MKFENHLEQLRKKFTLDLASRFEQIRTLYRQYSQDGRDKDELRQGLHRLAGLAGTFKASRISELARNLEIHLAQHFADGLEEEDKIIDILFAQFEKAVDAYLTQSTDSEREDRGKLILPRSDKTICLVEDDPLQAEQIALILQEAGYQVVIYHALPSFSEFLTGARPLPSLIMMDMVFSDSVENGASVIRQLREQVADFPPVIFISVWADIVSRVNAIRAGASEYLVKPVSSQALVETVDKYLSKATTYKILIVDDDAISSEYVAAIIQQAGMQARTLQDPLRIFETMEDFQPDLLILDIYMPVCSGIELAQVIRQCCCYSLIPIIFLTTNTTLDQELAALSSGGDEFVRKSDSDTYLMRKLESRLRRLGQIRDLNQQLQKAQRRSEQLRKLQSDFLSYVVHELKSPLHLILGYSDLLRAEAGLSVEQIDMLDVIVRGGQHQLEMINELSERAKIVAGKLRLNSESFDLLPLLGELINDAEVLAHQHRITLISAFEGSSAQVIKADRRRVWQVIANLLSNAIKYNKPGGSVWVSVQKRSNGLVRVTIRDNGMGIPAENLDNVFDAFERLGAQNSSVEGTGIGLSICSQLVQLMGGNIGVESEIDLGSSFWVELPINV